MKKLIQMLLLVLVWSVVTPSAWGQPPCHPCGCQLQGSFVTSSGDCGLTTTVTITVSGGTAPFTFGWSNGQQGWTATSNFPTFTITGLTPGTWGLWATSANGCGWFGNCEVTGLLNTMMNSWWVCGANGSCVMPSGGTPPYTYSWSNGEHGACIYDVPQGNYSVTVVDAAGCMQVASNWVNELLPPEIMMVNTTNSTCNQSNGSAFAMAQGTGTLQYEWFGPNGFTATGQTITGLVAGPYTVLVTDANGCTATEQVFVGNFGQPVVVHLYGTTCVPSQSGNFTQNLQQVAWPYCDSTVITHVALLPSSATTLSVSICTGESYAFNGLNLTQAGVYKDTLVAFNGCDSIVTLNLTVLPNSATSISAQICQGSTYNFNGQNLTTSGIYTTVLQSLNGCDSTVTLTLSVLANFTSTFSQTICHGDFFWYFGYRTVSGLYSHTYQAVSGCDSVVTLNLTVLPPADTVLVFETTCKPWEAGTFPTVLQNSIFCDSVVTIRKVTLNQLPNEFEMVPTCDPAQSGNWSVENLITQDSCPYKKVTILAYQIPATATIFKEDCNPANLGVVIDTLKNIVGCDSLYLTTVTTLSNFIQTQTQQTICAGESVIFGGVGLFAPGIYRDTLQSFTGCDSISILFLTVQTPPQGSESQTICGGESFQWNGEDFQFTGNYFHVFEGGGANGCDSLAMLHLTVLLPNDTINQYQETCILAQNGQQTVTTASDANGCDLVTVKTLYWQPAFWHTVATDTCVEVLNGAVVTDTVFENGCNGIRTRIFSYSPNYESFTTWSCDGPTSDTTYQTTVGGCVTEVTIHRLLYPSATGYESQQVCSSEFPFDWNGVTISQEGNYTTTLANASWHGCDSTAHLTVFELPGTQAFDTVAVCPGGFYTFEGNQLGEGEYEFPGTTITGCDSMFTLVVMEIDYQASFQAPTDMILIAPVDTLFEAGEWIEALTQGATTELSLPLGMTLTSSSLVQTSDSTWVQSFVFNTPCENMEMSRTILVRSSEDQIELPETCRFRIYPNPSSVGQNVTGEFEGFFGELKLTITSSTGSLETESVHQVNGFNQQIQINFPQQKGVWFLRIQDNEHNFVVRVVKH